MVKIYISSICPPWTSHTHYSPFTQLCCNFGKCAKCNCAPMPSSPLYFLPNTFILPHLHNTQTLILTYTPHTNRKDCLYDQYGTFVRTVSQLKPTHSNNCGVTCSHSLVLTCSSSSPVNLIMTTWLKCGHALLRRFTGGKWFNRSSWGQAEISKSLIKWRNRMMEERSCSNTCKWQTTKEKAQTDHAVPTTVVTHVRLSRRSSFEQFVPKNRLKTI